jgi:hypothetical protein
MWNPPRLDFGRLVNKSLLRQLRAAKGNRIKHFLASSN